MKFFKIFLLFATVAIPCNIYAQRTKPSPKITKPILTITLGGNKDSTYITPQMCEAIIGMPIKIVNTKNEEYPVSSYQFLYRKIVTSEEEETGKAYSTTSTKSALFKITPLPTMWQDAIKEKPRPGEEIIFFDVIVKDKDGKFMYAPNLKLMIR